MPTLPSDLRNKLERTCIAARNLAERAAVDALKSLAVAHHEPYGHMTPAQRTLRNQLWARARQLGDTADAKGQRSIAHLAQECAYEHWHRMLFARFLAENNLLIEPDMGVAVSLEEAKELAKEAKTNLWALAGRYAQTMLPEIFRADDAVLQVPLAREDQLKLEALLDGLAQGTFTATDSLGWCYQFWQAERKDQVNAAGNKIGAEELPSVTQLFTEDYMVDFLLDNTLGAWWAGKQLPNAECRLPIENEEAARKAMALPGCPWKYLRFVSSDPISAISASSAVKLNWQPAAGRFDGWPKTAKELKCLDPCCGSGHFLVVMFERLVALRMAEEKLTEKAAVAAVINENLFGLEIDPRCTQIGAFSVALAAWRRVGYCALPAMHIACSGLAPNAREADWLALAGDNQKLQRGMERLYRLFKNAPVLGSLINPRADEGDLLVAAFHELQPLLEKALETEKTTGYLREGVAAPAKLEMAVTARGLAKAAEILADQFTLVATNVPYLGRGNQEDVLKDYCERIHPEAKTDLATCFVERCMEFCAPRGGAALVTPQAWLFLGKYKAWRCRALKETRWDLVNKLGSRAFETIGGEVVSVVLICLSKERPEKSHSCFGLEVTEDSPAATKAVELLNLPLCSIPQLAQLSNPDSRVIIASEASILPLLEKKAFTAQGISTTDGPQFIFCWWELPRISGGWEFFQTATESDAFIGGCRFAICWEACDRKYHRLISELKALNRIGGAWQAGRLAWGKKGLTINVTSNKLIALYSGYKFDITIGVLVANDENHLPAIYCYLTSEAYLSDLRKLDCSLSVTESALVKVPFDLAHWQKVAAEKYPQGLPKPFSSDPTQWLFNGQPKSSDHPLQVAVARLLGYQWPRQTGSSFPDCPALGPDGLEKLADDDGIVCLPSVRGEAPAAERLRQLLQAAYGKDWKAHTELELIRATGSDAADLDEWLRNDFFAQHCNIFQHRPFIWHIWDGRKRDGFHALVNYHTLAGEKGKGRRTLESLTHSYLGDWITRQKDGLKRGEEGADERLAAAQALKDTLEAIIDGEPPYDIFVRWKGLAAQAIGWNPDINDGVRMNIRPFLATDIPGGKKGAGVLRIKPNIKWDKDRGKEPPRDRAEYPWFYDGPTFTGDRVNDVHLTKKQKEAARP